MSILSDRLRAIVIPGGGSVPASGHSVHSAGHAAETVLGGEWRSFGGSSCVVVETCYDGSHLHGRERVGDLAAHLADCGADAAMLTRGDTPCAPFVFFDLETTGLSGGAGTYAFLVGCGSFDDEGQFVTRQFVLTRIGDEPSLLNVVSAELARAGALVSFNGKSFDAPVLEMRYLYHRLPWTGGRVPHVDVLHPARRFWAGDDCSLGSLEQRILGVAARPGDVPGFEIPARYFQFLRSGDARPLAAVLEHNRLDLLSLAALTARLLRIIGSGPVEARDAREAHALGRTYDQAGFDALAIDAYERAVSMPSSGATRIDAIRSLATAYRRARRFDDAAGCWRRLVELHDCPPLAAREANEALAIHHEHRVRDLAEARLFAERALHYEQSPAWKAAVRYRLARLERRFERQLPLR